MGNVGAMLLVSHGGDGKEHQLCGGDSGSSLKSVDPPLQVQSNQRLTPVLMVLALVYVGRGGP